MIDRLRGVFGIGRVRLVDDAGPVQAMQVDEGPADGKGGRRLIDKVLKVGQFGFASVPPLGAEILIARIFGDRTASIAIGSNHQPSRPRNLKPGDCAVFDVRGAIVKLTAEGIEIDAAGLPFVLKNYSTATIAGDLHVEGTVTADTDVSGGGISLKNHHHGGVQTGAGETGAPV